MRKPNPSPDVVMDLATCKVLCKHLFKGEKIQAIKVIREVYAIGIKEAKDIVEGNAW